MTAFHWRITVLTVFRYLRSLLRIKIKFKVQHRFLELLTTLVKWAHSCGSSQMCDHWCVTTDVWPLMCDHWCVTTDVWPLMCEHWCVTTDVWPLMCDHWCVTTDVWAHPGIYSHIVAWQCRLSLVLRQLLSSDNKYLQVSFFSLINHWVTQPINQEELELCLLRFIITMKIRNAVWLIVASQSCLPHESTRGTKP